MLRVSSTRQKTDRQLDGVTLDRSFIDKVSGSTTNRPQLKECLGYVRQGDTLHIHSMDRLARNLSDLQAIVDDLTGKGVAVKFHKEGLTFSTESNAMNTLMLQMMGAFAQFERALIHERQAEGITKAKAKGKHLGRPCTITKEQKNHMEKMLKEGKPKAHIAKALDISRQSVYRLIKEA